MEITIVAKLSVTQEFATAGVDPDEALKDQTMDEWKKAIVAGLLENLKGQAIKVKSGVFENMIQGVITEIKEVKQKGKILYIAPLPQGLKIDRVRSGYLPISTP